MPVATIPIRASLGRHRVLCSGGLGQI